MPMYPMAATGAMNLDDLAAYEEIGYDVILANLPRVYLPLPHEIVRGNFRARPDTPLPFQGTMEEEETDTNSSGES